MPFLIHGPLLSPVKPGLLANLCKRDGAKQTPQIFGVGEFELTILNPPEKCAACGLHNIFGTHAPP
jgi:hypothetical protein